MIQKTRLWLGRILIGAVLAMNVQSAVAFWNNPARYAPAYELTGIPGQAAIRGFAILFLMWNVPYLLAAWHPARMRISVYEALAMQSLGLVGETLIYVQLPASHPILAASILRFIIFDGAGLIFLLVGWLLTRRIAPE